MDDYEQVQTDVVSIMPLPDDVPRRPCVVLITGANAGAIYPVEHATVLGRDPEAGISIQAEGISRLHCQFTIQEEDTVHLRDLDSKNGTRVNGSPVTGTVKLGDGDRIQVGSDTVLKLVFQDELEAAFQAHLYDAALKDGLTGLYNRRYLDERLRAEFSWARRNGAALTLCLLGLDNLEQVSETFGRKVGDAVLKAVGDLLSGSVRTEDTICRYGDQGFAIICLGIPLVSGVIVSERLRRTIEQHTFTFQDQSITLDVSVGVAGIPDDTIGHAAALVAAANRALRSAGDPGCA